MTSAYSSYSGCRQYRENIGGPAPRWRRRARASTSCGTSSTTPASSSRWSTRARGAGRLPADGRATARTRLHRAQHPARRWRRGLRLRRAAPRGLRGWSPTARRARPRPGTSSTRAAAARRTAVARARHQRPPRARCAAEGVRTSWSCPIGFVSDHMEVVYDLDTEAAALAPRARPAAARGRPPRDRTRRFVAMVRELVLERVGGRAASHARKPRAAAARVSRTAVCPGTRRRGPRRAHECRNQAACRRGWSGRRSLVKP